MPGLRTDRPAGVHEGVYEEVQEAMTLLIAVMLNYYFQGPFWMYLVILAVWVLHAWAHSQTT